MALGRVSGGALTRPARPRLLLFTGLYPYGRGEAFLEPEIAHLAAAFDQVTVVPRHVDGALRELPPNVRVDDTLAARHRPRGRRNRPRALAACLTSRHFYAELARRPATFVQVPAADRLVGHLAGALRVAAWLEDEIAAGRFDPRCDVCYCYWLWVEALGAGILRARHPELRIVARAHGFDVYAERHEPPYIPLQRLAIRAADRVCTVSEHGRAYLAAAHPREAGRIEVARLGTVDPAGCSAPSGDGVLRVLTCSRIEAVKRLDLVVRALAALARQRPGQAVEWTHYGDGVQRDLVRAEAERSLPPSIGWRLRGEVPNAVVREHYLREPVDVLLNVSRSEGVPVSMMEAQSFGVPVVATAVGGVPEIVTDGTGILLSPDPTPDEVAAALLRLTASSPDVTRMRAASREQWEQRYRATVNFPAFVNDVLLARRDAGARRSA